MTDDSQDRTGSALLTLTEAAAVLRTPVATLRYWRHLGIGPAGFRLGRRVLYRRDDLDRWVESQRTAQAVDRPRR
jgi:excisionase family DNA binding protein